jgi:Methyltransferase domain
MSLLWKIDECSAYSDRIHMRGWCFSDTPTIVRVELVFQGCAEVVVLTSFGQPSADVAAIVNPHATHCRFDEWLIVPVDALEHGFRLRFTFADQTTSERESGVADLHFGDPYFACWEHFKALLHTLKSGAVLEIGSRARSGITYRELVPTNLEYVGMDILPGPNVDVVGDAHELEKLFGSNRFVAAFSRSVFEHLAMPWKVAIELNRVLVPGAIVFTASHQTWPLHDEPWDFWRFSSHTWATLFNASTGFEVLEAVCGEPARIHAVCPNPATRTLQNSPAFLGSASIVRKISETALTWPVSLQTASRDSYPVGELSEPPT